MKRALVLTLTVCVFLVKVSGCLGLSLLLTCTMTGLDWVPSRPFHCSCTGRNCMKEGRGEEKSQDQDLSPDL